MISGNTIIVPMVILNECACVCFRYSGWNISMAADETKLFPIPNPASVILFVRTFAPQAVHFV